MPNVRVKIINTSTNELPAYATSGSAGMDIRANLASPVVLQPLERQLIPTGLFIELPEGHEAQVRPRSGLAIKQGIT
ncbi:MAG TPA: dUTP diphosphatase, partial [Ferruginibacter sp.]|nr:dUTP diphosphatase [Ferruginibacter sp.]